MSETVRPDVCPAEHAGWLTIPLRRFLTDPRRLFKGLVAPGDVVADLGCGPGFFTLPLAEAVGDRGTVVAVDLQAAMLDRVRERASRRGLAARVRLQHCRAESLGLDEVAPIDFALAFWMVHEVPDAAHLMAEVHDALRPGGRLLVAEPKGHVGEARWTRTVRAAEAAGLTVAGRPAVRLSRAAVFARPGA
jgi:ubiquinone/menaquinone biosynthesis C-methylase UbiE